VFYNKEPNVQLALTPADDFWGIVKFGALGLKMFIFFINKTYMHKNHTKPLFRRLYVLAKSVPFGTASVLNTILCVEALPLVLEKIHQLGQALAFV